VASTYKELVELMFKVYGTLHSGVLGAGKRCEEHGRLDIGVLGYLSRRGKSSLSETADVLCISHPQMSVLADRLVAEGLIERTRDGEDRRISWIATTPEGQAALGEALDSTVSRVQKLLEPLSPEELDCIKSSLKLLIDVMGKENN
jgi:DNA-binding MarR family transcriptional regulator